MSSDYEVKGMPSIATVLHERNRRAQNHQSLRLNGLHNTSGLHWTHLPWNADRSVQRVSSGCPLDPGKPMGWTGGTGTRFSGGALHGVVFYCIVVHCSVWYCIMLHCTLLYCIVVHHIWLHSHCVALHCNVLHWSFCSGWAFALTTSQDPTAHLDPSWTMVMVVMVVMVVVMVTIINRNSHWGE